MDIKTSCKECLWIKYVYTITFEHGSVADANRWASELKEHLLDASDEVIVEQQREHPHTQDLGTVLSLVLGTPAVIAVAKAIGQWLNLHREAGITIKTARGELVAKNVTQNDVVKLAELMLAQQE